MRRLKLIEHISLDGVIQHSADDDEFSFGDWTAPYRTPAGRDAMRAAYGDRFDLLLGRRTYDAWSGYWPKAPSSPMADGQLHADVDAARARARGRSADRRLSRAAGQGQALRRGGTPASALELVSTQAMPTGIIFNTYGIVGPLQTA